jgi:hypothetical protein
MANLDSGNPFRSGHWTSLKKTAFESVRKALAIATLLVMAVNGGWAQEIDSSVLQAKAVARNVQEDATAKPQQAAPEPAAPVQASSAQTSAPKQGSVPQTPAQPTAPPQASAPQSGQPQRGNRQIPLLSFLRGRSCLWDYCAHSGSRLDETFICRSRFL